MEYNTDHLNELRHRLDRETARMNAATSERERKIRAVWIAQTIREVADEMAFLEKRGVVIEPDMTDDELLAALEA